MRITPCLLARLAKSSSRKIITIHRSGVNLQPNRLRSFNSSFNRQLTLVLISAPVISPFSSIMKLEIPFLVGKKWHSVAGESTVIYRLDRSIFRRNLEVLPFFPGNISRLLVFSFFSNNSTVCSNRPFPLLGVM